MESNEISWIRNFSISNQHLNDPKARQKFVNSLRNQLDDLVKTRAISIVDEEEEIVYPPERRSDDEPEFLNSVVFYGLNQSNYQVGTELDALKLGEDIKQAIRDFEPRLDSILVQKIKDNRDKATDGTLSITFAVTATLKSQKKESFRNEITLDVAAGTCYVK